MFVVYDVTPSLAPILLLSTDISNDVMLLLIVSTLQVHTHMCVCMSTNLSIPNKIYSLIEHSAITQLPLVYSLIECSTITQLPLVYSLIEHSAITQLPLVYSLIEHSAITQLPLVYSLIECLVYSLIEHSVKPVQGYKLYTLIEIKRYVSYSAALHHVPHNSLILNT